VAAAFVTLDARAGLAASCAGELAPAGVLVGTTSTADSTW
jgi:hypothetical protein